MTISSCAGRRALGVGGGLIAGLLCAAALAGPAGATTYNETFNFNPANLTCGYFANGTNTEQLCAESVAFASTRAANAGDIYNVNVTMPGTLTIPGSSSQNLFLVNLLEPNVTLGPGAAGSDVAKSHMGLSNYSGPAGPITGGGTTLWNQGYFATAGFCCGYGEPNSGFSISGASATIQLASGDPHGLASMAVSIDTVLQGAAPQTLTGASGGNRAAPATLPTGPIGSISGNISGGGPEQQYYGFHWNGGEFEAVGQVTGADPRSLFEFEVFNKSGTVEDAVLLDHANNFSGFLDLALPKGPYIIGLDAFGPFDPPYTIQFLSPVTGGAVPEPGAWAMMLVGVGIAGGLLRRRAKLA